VTATLLLLILLLAVAALVVVYVLRPLLARPAASADADSAAVSRSVLRERRRELEAALAHLPADAPERRAALAEFAAQADAELSTAAPLPADVTRMAPADAERPVPAGAAERTPATRRWTAVALAAVLVVPSFGLYLLAGAPEAASPEFRAAREPASLDELAADLRQRLQREPDQLEGWRLLGRAELARGEPDAARQAFEQALRLAPDDAQARVDLADALAQAQGAVLAGRPIELIREALAIDPKLPKALALAGAYEVGRGDAAAAIGHWTRLVEVLPADSEQRRQVESFVADLKAGRTPRVAAAAPGPSDAAAALRGRVELERRLAGRVQPDDTVFVVARALDASGRPTGAPLAVLRARGADLPLEFALDDRSAMSPAATLSSLAPGTQVVVIARVSRSGEAGARTGDLQGASAPSAPGVDGLRVLIDTVID
jgi:cytochrome c-type biogenesis protein CcmH